MALGVPVVATASSGPQDIVTPDVGLLTPVGDVSAFADGLSEMYRRRSEFDPEQVREDVSGEIRSGGIRIPDAGDLSRGRLVIRPADDRLSRHVE